MSRLTEIVKLTQERKLTKSSEIDELIREKFPYIGYVTRVDYRQTVLMILKNEVPTA